MCREGEPRANRVSFVAVLAAVFAGRRAALGAGELDFHEGTIGGAWPRIIG